MDDDIFLSEDLWIRKRLSELVQSEHTLTPRECNEVVKHWCNLSNISRFLWRITEEGTRKFANNTLTDVL